MTLIFHWRAQWLILVNSKLSLAAELSILCATEKNEVSSVNNLALDNNSSTRSFMYIKNSNGPSIEPCGTPASTLVHVEAFPFKTALCFLFLKKSHNKFKSSPDMLFYFDSFMSDFTEHF